MPYSTVTHTRLTPELAAAVRKYARENETHPATVVRLAVKKFLEAQETKTAQRGDNNATSN